MPNTPDKIRPLGDLIRQALIKANLALLDSHDAKQRQIDKLALEAKVLRQTIKALIDLIDGRPAPTNH